MGRQIAITLTDEQQSQLDVLAAASVRSPEELIQRAVADYLAYDENYRAAVEEGDADFAAGRIHDFQDVARELKAQLETRTRDRHG